jgi:hypothetical protein
MKEYTEHPEDGTLVFEGMSIPADNGNRHYREFLELERQGIARKVSAPSIDPWIEVRGTRNSLLSSSDWTQVSDNKLSGRQKSEWRAYRNQLREITTTFNKAENVVWPRPPLV